jgi:hypothetical protein
MLLDHKILYGKKVVWQKVKIFINDLRINGRQCYGGKCH